ncbi:hypothetical protein SELMODRAFT_78295, partial [Selaginella moellendorffii]
MFTLLFEVLSSTDKPEEMEWLLDQMPKWGIPMNALTYEILIAKVCRFGAAESAYEVFQEMKDVEHQPSVAAYASLVESLSKAGREDIAIQVLEEMETPSAEVYNPLVRNLVLAGKLGVALTQYKKMLE